MLNNCAELESVIKLMWRRKTLLILRLLLLFMMDTFLKPRANEANPSLKGSDAPEIHPPS